jgi:hypothetical protein
MHPTQSAQPLSLLLGCLGVCHLLAFGCGIWGLAWAARQAGSRPLAALSPHRQRVLPLTLLACSKRSFPPTTTPHSPVDTCTCPSPCASPTPPASSHASSLSVSSHPWIASHPWIGDCFSRKLEHWHERPPRAYLLLLVARVSGVQPAPSLGMHRQRQAQAQTSQPIRTCIRRPREPQPPAIALAPAGTSSCHACSWLG